MNILFVGPYRQNDGWGKAAIDYIKALNLTKYNISIAPIYMGYSIETKIEDELINLENKTESKYDVIIQNVLPMFFERLEGYNIGIHYTETKNLNYSLFIDKMNLMDELWVSSESEKEHLIKAGVKCKIDIVPIPINIDTINKNDNDTTIDIPQIKNKFVFYLMGEYVERKNFKAAITAFNREFSNDKNVGLVIKTGINGVDTQQAIQHIQNDIIELKKKLRLYNNIGNYTNEIIIADNLNISQMISLHKTFDCLIVPSRGEAYCRPAIEALYFNKDVICTEGIHTSSILKDKCYKVPSYEVPCLVDNPPHPSIYTGWETWDEIDILALQNKMREILNKKEKDTTKKQWVIDNFSYEAISEKMKEILCQL